MKHFVAFVTFVFLLTFPSAEAQIRNTSIAIQDLPSLLKAPTNAGTDFYFSFPPCYEEESIGFPNNCKVFVASSIDQTVTVEVPGKTWVATQIVRANNVVEFIIPTGVAQPFLKPGVASAPAEQVYERAAVHVFSESPVIVYGVTQYNFTSDGFLALPVSALGTEYVVAAYPQYTAVGSNHKLVSETTISAAYDLTVVTFVMGGTLQSETSGGLKPGKDTTFIMNRGDVLCFASNGDLQDISGSIITSTKPVGVVSGNQCANVPAGVFACDFISEMESPTYTWGKTYHITPFFGRKKNPIIRIFAKESNTKVYRDGQPWFVLSKTSGKIDYGFVERRAFDGDPKSVVITADKPIYVVEYNSGTSDDNATNTDPFELVLTPMEQYQKEIIFSTPGLTTSVNNFKNHYINLIYKVAADSSIPKDMEFATVINGKFSWEKVSTKFGSNRGELFTLPIDGQIYACKQIELLSEGLYSLRSSTKFAAYGYGFSSFDSYGFPLGVALADIGITDTVKPSISEFTQACDGSITNASVKDYPEDASMRSNLGLISLATDSNYNYKFTYGQTISYIAGQSRSTDWSLEVIDKTKDAHASLRFADRCGNDTTISVDYIANAVPSVTIKDGGDFGKVIAKHDSVKTITISNNYSKPLTIRRIELEKGDQGFALEQVSLPFVLAPGKTKDITVTFSNTTGATFSDSIGVGDSCKFSYSASLKAEVIATKPNIIALGHSFPIQTIDSRTEWKAIGLANTGTTDVTLTGDDHTTTLNGTPFEAIGWDLQYPIVLKAGDSLLLQVDFVPKEKGTYSASITFNADDNEPISSIELQGIAEGTTPIVTTDCLLKNFENQTSMGTISIANKGTVDVNFVSDNHIVALAGTPFKAVGWNIAYPFVLKVGSQLDLNIEFTPKKIGIDTATIIFYGNNNKPYKAKIIGIASAATDANENINKFNNNFTLTVSPNPIGTSGGFVEFVIPTKEITELTLISSNGIKAITLANSIFDVGTHQIKIPVEQLSSGSYILRLVSGKFSLEKTVVIVK